MLEGQTTLPRLRDLSRVWDFKKIFFLSFLFKEARFSVTGTHRGGGGGCLTNRAAVARGGPTVDAGAE